MKKSSSKIQKMLNIWAIVLVIWSFYRTKFYIPQLWFDEFFLKPLVFIIPVYFYIKRFESKSFFQSLWIKRQNFISDSYVGLSIGIFFGIIIFATNFIRVGNLSFLANITLAKIIYLLLLTSATAISEEILSRGFVTKRLFEDSKNVLSAAFLGSILFTIIHIPIVMTNYKISGNYILIFMSTEFFLSFINSIVFLERKSLLPSIQIHALYNFALLLYI